jgi:hypothetical protein
MVHQEWHHFRRDSTKFQMPTATSGMDCCEIREAGFIGKPCQREIEGRVIGYATQARFPTAGQSVAVGKYD